VTGPDQARQGIVYRVAILSADLRTVLARRHRGTTSLPRIRVSRGQRPAAAIQEFACSKWALNLVVLYVMPHSDATSVCAIAHVPTFQGLDAWSFVLPTQLPSSEVSDPERRTIAAICSGEECLGVFSRPGWVAEAFSWIQQKVGSRAALTGKISQLNATGTFALADYWMKATGDPNRHELSTTAALAQICPRYLPALVATRPEWNAWLMEDAGEPLTFQADESSRNAVVRSLARLQIGTVGSTDDLLAAGIADQRLPTVRRHLVELLEFIRHATGLQVSTAVPRVSSARIHEIGRLLKDALQRLEDLGLPDTVIHNDMNRGNILCRSGQYVFSDWCEGGIGPPIHTLQMLLMILQRDHGATGPMRAGLEAEYRDVWLPHLPSRSLDISFGLMPFVTPAFYLYGRGSWLHSDDRFDPHIQMHARSIARHLDRAAYAYCSL
jgi:hypothetical protein